MEAIFLSYDLRPLQFRAFQKKGEKTAKEKRLLACGMNYTGKGHSLKTDSCSAG